MGAPRFFVNSMLSPASVGTEVPLPDNVAHHALRVLRLGNGDSIVLFAVAHRARPGDRVE